MKISMIEFEQFTDRSGSLVPIEDGNIPFEIKRVYYIFDAKRDARRGFHAHKQLQQVLICIKGSCRVLLDDGKKQATVELNTPTKGLYLSGLTWRELFDFSEDCVLLVLASHVYDEDDYIRNYDQFVQLAANHG